MAAALTEVRGNIGTLRCPVTGLVLFDERDGFDERGDHSPHLRFFVDWMGQVWMPRPEDLPAGPTAETQRRLVAIWADAPGSMEALLEQWRLALPPSALLLRIVHGSTCCACYDLAAFDGPSMGAIRLYEL